MLIAFASLWVAAVPPLTPSAVLCHEPQLPKASTCIPGKWMAQLMETGELKLLHRRPTETGKSGAEVWTVSAERPGGGRVTFRLKWKEATAGGEMLNNSPRKELAAYTIQSWFLDESEWVVPATVGRCFPMKWYTKNVRVAEPTFAGTSCVYGVLAYWVENVNTSDVMRLAQFFQDDDYRRAISNFNILTYLIDHRDTHRRNFVVSESPGRFRALSIDNGVAFSGPKNPIALFIDDWGYINVPALSRKKITILKALPDTRVDALGTVVELEDRGGQLINRATSVPFDADSPVRRKNNRIQLGLTREEVAGVKKRLTNLFMEIEKGWLKEF